MTAKIFTDQLPSETKIVKKLLFLSKFRKGQQQLILAHSKKLIVKIRSNKRFSIEEFLYR